MLRRWLNGLLVTVIVSLVVVTAVGSAAAPLVDVLPSCSISADLGLVEINVSL
jgi:hypothetical protein